MDGVPFLTQPPVQKGESFTYAFDLPDMGTFFHPHCNVSGQTGRGLAALLLVEGDELESYAAERVVVLKDWRLAPDGSFLPFETLEGASRAGTFGTRRGVNGRIGRSAARCPPAPTSACACTGAKLRGAGPATTSNLT